MLRAVAKRMDHRCKSTQPESNRHVLHGKQTGFRYIMGAWGETELSKS